MDSIRSPVKLFIQVENNDMIMFGSADESSGCVLRGVLRFTLTQPIKVKSIGIRFIGKSLLTWSEAARNGPEQLYHEEEHTVVDRHCYCLARQPKLHTLAVGDHSYPFEFVLPGHLPETTQVTNFYEVEYKLKALVERPAFIPNQSVRQVIHVYRQLFSPGSPEFMEPVYTLKRGDDLEAIVSLPTKIYAYGDTISLTAVVSALNDHIQLDQLTCNLKEYIILGNSEATTRAHGRHLFSTKVKRFDNDNDDNLSVWTKHIDLTLPTTMKEMHCDMDNEGVRVRHKFKFLLDFHHTVSGETMQMRLAVPINICALPLNTQQLPAYESPATCHSYLPTYLDASPDDLPSYEEHCSPPLVF